MNCVFLSTAARHVRLLAKGRRLPATPWHPSPPVQLTSSAAWSARRINRPQLTAYLSVRAEHPRASGSPASPLQPHVHVPDHERRSVGTAHHRGGVLRRRRRAHSPPPRLEAVRGDGAVVGGQRGSPPGGSLLGPPHRHHAAGGAGGRGAVHPGGRLRLHLGHRARPACRPAGVETQPPPGPAPRPQPGRGGRRQGRRKPRHGHPCPAPLRA